MDCCGQEEVKVLDLCRERLSDAAVKDAFVLTYDRMRRYEGAWHMERRLLFPSYVFLESENEEMLSEELEKCRNAGQVEGVFRVNQEGEDFLRFLCGKNCHLKMSKGIIRKGITRITEGPLMGMEKQICQIDRHRRLAKVAVPFKQCHGRMPDRFGRLEHDFGYITAGLEIAEKTI